MKRKFFLTSYAGFTLIEMLTVVLIIGILMAIAIPQYRRVIQRSRATEAVRMLRVLSDSADRLAVSFGYRTVSGFATDNSGNFVFGRLDMTNKSTVPCSFDGTDKIMTCDHFTYTLNNNGTITAQQTGPDTGVFLTVYPDRGSSSSDFITCEENEGGGYCALYGYDEDDEEESGD